MARGQNCACMTWNWRPRTRPIPRSRRQCSRNAAFHQRRVPLPTPSDQNHTVIRGVQLNGLVEIAFRALMRAECGIDHRLFGDVVLRSELAQNVEKCVLLPRLREAHTASAHGVQHPCREHRRSCPRSRRAMGRQGAVADPAYDIFPQARNGREVNQAMAVIGPDRRSLLEN